ncbi:hypothetical protein [uncultured Albimonas sp.]|uniref:hypothetical protein n=1 Tax=uncultured Albimonas sp. TaxID=1331701 RepID=UPI0030EF481F|tara:strand:- start:3299 stop:3478 length:180 start_codon:yes stop_codon:yes gene_type:complete
MQCEHGPSAFGPGQHALAVDGGAPFDVMPMVGSADLGIPRKDVVNLCRSWIEASDLVFA